jgi:stearoyl-CoA desaturase (delta-9 desaturase)
MFTRSLNFVGADAEDFATRWEGVAYALFLSYVPIIFLLRFWMSHRLAFDLALPLRLWNISMAVLSAVGFVVNLGYLMDVDFETSYTSVSSTRNGTYGFVLFAFRLSKIPELLDTVFIVLRKKQLLTLHWIHHLTVMIYCWFCLYDHPPTGYWFAQVNMFVHMVTYGYFAWSGALKGMTWFNPMLLTILQIIQMTWGLIISVLYLLHPSTTYTREDLLHAAYAIPMYASCLYLFCSFFSTKYRFETPVNWAMCGYIGGIHLLAFFGIRRWLQAYSWWVLVETILWYQICAFGITAGSHRLWAHRSYMARAPTRCVLMLLASMSNQGGIYHWARDHRVHHKESDKDADPHNINRGFFYSHMGWLLLKKSDAVKKAGMKLDCSDLLLDPFVWIQYTLNPVWDQFWCFVVPGFYGLWRLGSFWDGFLIFGALRWVLLIHATWCVNSVSHTFGYHPYNSRPPADNLFTTLLAAGEGWHNFHHAYPFDYATAEHNWWKSLNTTKMLIDLLWLLGQTSNHKRKVIHNQTLKTSKVL